MADRTVTVRLQAAVSDYTAKLAAASRATTDLANKVDLAKGRAAAGYQALGKGMMVAGGLVAAGAALAVHEMAGFESRLAQVKSLSGASASEMGRLRNAALTVGTAFGISADQAADAEIELTKAGIGTADMLNGALKGALTLAAAGQIDVAQATEIAASAMTQFGLHGKDVPHIADLLAAGADRALGGVGDLGYGLDQAGLQAHSFGISIEETVGTLSAFASAGLIGERGGTTFKQMLIQLASPSKQASDILAELKINAYDASGQFVGMANLAGQLKTKMSGLTQAEKNHALAVIFGSRAVLGANVLMQEGAKGIDEWTKKVNVSGFAALQAAGKMDSLSGDVQKLKAALQSAFIGAGENANGPLREIVQDVTSLINAWNGLPGPVKTGIEVLTLAGGSMALVGGAALVLVPKVRAVDEALRGMSGGAITARGAMGRLAKGGLVVGTLAGIYEGAKALGDALNKTVTPSVEETTDALINLQMRGQYGVDWLENVAKFAATLKGNPLEGNAGQIFKNVDQALAELVTGGHLDVAQDDFKDLQRYLLAAGYSTDEITKLFPQLSAVLSQSENSAKLAADGMDEFGNQTDGAGNAMVTATQRAKDFNDALHALTDPVFAFNQALQDLKAKQKAVNDAASKYGKGSKQYKQALLDEAQAAFDAMSAAHNLHGAIKDNSAASDELKGQLDALVKAGFISTKTEADILATTIDNLTSKASRLSRTDPHVDIYTNTHGSESKLTNLERQIAGLHDKTININTNQHVNGGAGGHLLNPQSDETHAAGGWVGPRGGVAGFGEFVVNRRSSTANAPLLEAVNRGARLEAIPVQRYSGGVSSTTGRTIAFGDTIINYPEPEKASEAVPRVQRDMLVRTGAGWR